MLDISQTRIFCLKDVSIGKLLVARSQKGICHIALGDTIEQLLQGVMIRFDNAQQIVGDNTFKREVAHIIAMIETPRLVKKYNFPLDINGTVFQRQVWAVLCDIPCGETISYEVLARRIGIPSAFRAVANACARNELAVIIPCHRVVRKNGLFQGIVGGTNENRFCYNENKMEKFNFV